MRGSPNAARITILGPADEELFERIAEGVFDQALRPELVRAFLHDPRHHICVALVDDQIVGFASAVDYIHPDKPRELWINEVGVANAYRRRGLGQAILDRVFQHARTLGCKEAWVATERSNSNARAF